MAENKTHTSASLKEFHFMQCMLNLCFVYLRCAPAVVCRANLEADQIEHLHICMEYYLELCRNEPETILEGAAMSGLVGILRQLGDLALLAAEVFHGLHDQVTAASTRARGLTLRARQLEAELPLIEKHRCSLQHVVASDIGRVYWRADLNRGVVAGGRVPRFVAEHIERCRGPPELSMLDKYDADGEGTCLKRYTDPSFFRTDSACSTKHALLLQEIRPNFQSSDNSSLPKAACNKCSKFQTDASDRASDGHLSMLRQLKYRQTNVSVLRSIEPKMHDFHDEDSSNEKASTIHRSEVNMSFTCSSEPSTQVTDIAVNEERACDLERTSSFGAWLSPDAAPTPEREIAEETSLDTCNGFFSHVASNGTDLVGASQAMENSNAARNVNSLVEFVASRASNLPRKPCVKKHNPLTESFSKMARKLLELRYDAIRDNRSYDFELHRENHDASDKEAAENSDNKVPSKDAPDLDEIVFDNKSTEYTQQQVISEQSDEPCELACPPASIDEEASDSVTDCNPKDTNLRMLVTNPVFSCDTSVPDIEQCHLHGLHQPIIHQEQNGCSEDTEDDTIPPLPPIPRMQWLSVKVRTGSGIASPELRTVGPKSPATGPAAKSDFLQAVRKQKVASRQDSSCTSQTEMAETLPSNENVSADISHTSICRDSFLGKQPEEISHRESFRKDPAPTSEGKRSVFFSAVEQPRKTSPPSVPRPKYSLLELRTAPSLIYPSRALSGEWSVLLEHIKNRSANLKPVPRRSSNAMADGIRQVHAHDDDIGSNDTCSDSD